MMIVDFDAHQGNGHERDFINDEKVYIMDMYNRWIYPNDRHAKGQCALAVCDRGLDYVECSSFNGILINTYVKVTFLYNWGIT